jgi:superfamily II DNA or RNA helicase
MYQMKDSFERDLNTQVSVLGDGQFGHTVIKDGREVHSVKRMSVGMVQTLVSRLEEKTIESETEKVVGAIAKKELKLANAEEKRITDLGMFGAAFKAHMAKFEANQAEHREKLANIKSRVAVKVHEHMQERAKTINLLSMFGLVILEEAHEASGNSYYDILKHCVNAHYRLALTGTPFMKDSEESNMRLMACSGPIAIKISEEMLIDRGILAQPHFKIIKLPLRVAKLHRLTPWQAAYRIGIAENKFRNDAIVNECARFTRLGMTSMVLIQHVSHGDTLIDMLRAKGMRVEFIRGEDDQAERKSALYKLANNDIDVLLGTTILDVGVDVPAVGHICLGGGGKAEVALRQRIGRGLRAKKSGPNVCFVTDFSDIGNDTLAIHAAQRLGIIKSTKGFDRHIYENGKDFDFVTLGIEKSTKAA